MPRKRLSRTSLKQAEEARYCDHLLRIQDWAERRKIPFRTLMIDIVEKWAHHNRVALLPARHWKAVAKGIERGDRSDL
jgi:hypothetical protein